VGGVFGRVDWCYLLGKRKKHGWVWGKKGVEREAQRNVTEAALSSWVAGLEQVPQANSASKKNIPTCVRTG